jgi:hypothetical protein
MIYLLTRIGLTPGGSSTVHIYTQIVHRTTKKKKKSSFNHAAYSYKLTCQRLNRLLLFSSVSFTTEPTID